MFQFRPDLLVASLPYMLKGMVGIFAVIAVIYLATVAVNKVFKSK